MGFVDDAVEIDEDIGYFFNAFARLSRSRPSGMGAGALVLSEIVCYWERLEEVYALEFFIDVVQELDHLFLSHHYPPQETNKVLNAKPKGSHA